MLQNLLRQKFGVHEVDEVFRVNGYDAARKGDRLYMLVPVGAEEIKTISDRKLIVDHYLQNGDRNVCDFLQTKEGEAVIGEEGRNFVILTSPVKKKPARLGRKLAKFHHRGRSVSFDPQSMKRIGRWKVFWEKRLDQMEKVWSEALMQPPESEFEKLFIESFPYYMGLAENGIQYLVDTEIDDEPRASDYGTVCHIRFGNDTWGNGAYLIKNPFHWVFDHCARDLADWAREQYFRNIKTYIPGMQAFFRDYTTIAPLSSFTWRLLYARLLFPLHYFDCVEEYYMTASEERKYSLWDRLQKMVQHTEEYEHFLRDFFQIANAPVRSMQIPFVEWLY